jgi:hypothetical protein
LFKVESLNAPMLGFILARMAEVPSFLIGGDGFALGLLDGREFGVEDSGVLRTSR